MLAFGCVWGGWAIIRPAQQRAAPSTDSSTTPHHHQIPITKQDDEGLAALVHEGQGHISPILDALIDEENVYMVMPYFHGKDLYQKVSLCTCPCACLCVCLSVVGR